MEKAERIQHFGVQIKKSNKNKLTRETYAIIDKKSSLWSPRMGKLQQSFYDTDDERKKDYDDEECKIYSDLYCARWKEKCLINYDKNMEFFKQIPQDKFVSTINALIESNKNIKEIFDLNDCSGIRGIYIMVLDEYKQVYIGQANDIKKRIMTHWSKQKEFDRLLCGNLNESVMSIDSFGALDTTRIFVLATDSIDFYEKDILSKFPPYLKLNRIGGGVPSDNIDILISFEELNLRSLKDLHNEKFAEKYAREVSVTYFVSREDCSIRKIAIGDLICIEQFSSKSTTSVKVYGKVHRITKTDITLVRYCGPSTHNHCDSHECHFRNDKQMLLRLQNFPITKTTRFSKVDMVEINETRISWRSKIFPDIEA